MILRSNHKMIAIAALGSLLLLLGAYVFQALGYAPCKLCYWQRYPHMIAIIAGAIAFLGLPRAGAAIGGIAALTTAGVGIYHAGVEQKWWAGPTSCSGNSAGLNGLSGESLLSTDVLDKVVMCDQISWAFMGLSMPAWNAMISLVLAGVWGLVFVNAQKL